jgi:hypothetical protein
MDVYALPQLVLWKSDAARQFPIEWFARPASSITAIGSQMCR